MSLDKQGIENTLQHEEKCFLALKQLIGKDITHLFINTTGPVKLISVERYQKPIVLVKPITNFCFKTKELQYKPDFIIKILDNTGFPVELFAEAKGYNPKSMETIPYKMALTLQVAQKMTLKLGYNEQDGLYSYFVKTEKKEKQRQKVRDVRKAINTIPLVQVKIDTLMAKKMTKHNSNKITKLLDKLAELKKIVGEK